MRGGSPGPFGVLVIETVPALIPSLPKEIQLTWTWEGAGQKRSCFGRGGGNGAKEQTPALELWAVTCLVAAAHSLRSGEMAPAVGKRGLQAGINTHGWGA